MDFPIIIKLGGVEAVYQRLQQECRLKTPNAVRMWRVRRRIPGEAQVALMSWADTEGIAYCADDFRLARPGKAA